MRSYVAGTDLTIPIPLVWNGEPFVPDDGDVIWNVRDNAGAVVVSVTTLHGVTDTTAFPVVLAAVNALTGSNAVEKRTVSAAGKINALPFVITVPYRIHPFLNTSAQPADVRKFLGIDEGELPDDDIDLVSAFFDVAELTGLSILQAATTTKDRDVSKALVGQAVISLLPSLAARISKAESDGNSTVERFKLDLEALEALARIQRDSSITKITSAIPTVKKFTASSLQVDPLTGT